jgi:hypothetical protein
MVPARLTDAERRLFSELAATSTFHHEEGVVTHAMIRYQHRACLDLDAFARAASLHPDLVRRLVALGLLEPDRDDTGGWWFT